MGGGRHLLPPDPEKKEATSARATSGRRDGRGKASPAPPSGGARTE